MSQSMLTGIRPSCRSHSVKAQSVCLFFFSRADADINVVKAWPAPQPPLQVRFDLPEGATDYHWMCIDWIQQGLERKVDVDAPLFARLRGYDPSGPLVSRDPSTEAQESSYSGGQGAIPVQLHIQDQFLLNKSKCHTQILTAHSQCSFDVVHGFWFSCPTLAWSSW